MNEPIEQSLPEQPVSPEQLAPEPLPPNDEQAALGPMTIESEQLQRIIEGILLSAGRPLTVAELGELFEDDERPGADAIRTALAAIAEGCQGRGFQLREVASGFRFQVVQDVAPWVARLWEEKPQRYSRALLETLALIAYRQPITRGDIEDIRGVAVATNIIKTLLERDWVRVVGHKDVPGRPAMYATTRKFLDYFNLKNLDELPALAEIRDLDTLNAELALEGADTVLQAETGEAEAQDDESPAADTAANEVGADEPALTSASPDAGSDSDSDDADGDADIYADADEEPALEAAPEAFAETAPETWQNEPLADSDEEVGEASMRERDS